MRLLPLLLLIGCGATPAPTSETPAGIRCNTNNTWDPHLKAERNATIAELMKAVEAELPLDGPKREALKDRFKSPVMWQLVRTLLIAGNHNNFSALELKPLGRTLYRTGFTPEPEAEDSCVRSLVKAGGVKHILNLYAGEMRTADLESAERKVIEAAGGSYFSARSADKRLSHWRELLREGPDKLPEAQAAVADLINEHILRPPGGLRGNIHLHCGGGMHRTGMVVGILDRCLNKADAASIEADYSRHVAWRSDARKGGFEADNLTFIHAFDCGLLKLP